MHFLRLPRFIRIDQAKTKLQASCEMLEERGVFIASLANGVTELDGIFQPLPESQRYWRNLFGHSYFDDAIVRLHGLDRRLRLHPPAHPDSQVVHPQQLDSNVIDANQTGRRLLLRRNHAVGINAHYLIIRLSPGVPFAVSAAAITSWRPRYMRSTPATLMVISPVTTAPRSSTRLTS